MWIDIDLSTRKCKKLAKDQRVDIFAAKGEICTKYEFLVASAGPVLNLLLMLSGAILGFKEFCIANLFMLVINLLPVYPLDGGRILFTILKNELSSSTLRVVMKVISVIVIGSISVFGCILVYKTGVNFSVLLTGLFLCFTSDKVDYKIPAEPAIKTVHYVVNIEQTAKNILKYRKRNRVVVFDVMDVCEHYMGSVTYKEVLEFIANFGYEIKFGEILEKQLLY